MSKFESKRGTAAARLKTRRLMVAFMLGVSPFAFASPASPQQADEVQAQVYLFERIEVRGNKEIDAQTIIALSEIKTGVPLDAAALNTAYQNIANAPFFQSTALNPQGNILIIEVQEAPIIGAISFEGNRLIKDKILEEIVTSKVRRVYSPADAEADAAAIAETYRARGRMNAQITPVTIKRNDSRLDLVFEIDESGVSEIESLNFVGNRAYSDFRLRQVLETKQAGLLRQVFQSDTFIAERLELDKTLLTDFYRARGYVDFAITDASAEVSRARDAVFVTFTVSEGQKFSFENVSVRSEITGVDAADYADVIKAAQGDTYSPVALDNDTIRIENLALRQGVNFLRVEPRITRNQRQGTLDVEFVLVRGPRVFVERIEVKGNTSTRDNVIRRAFRTGEGDPFNPREIKLAAERLRALGYFKDVQVTSRQGSAPDQIIIDAVVEEQPTGSLSLGGTYGFDEGFGYNIGFSESNFLGRGQAVNLRFSGGLNNTLSEVSLTEPSFLDRELSLSLGAYYSVSKQNNALYDTDGFGGNLGLGFPTGELSRVEFRYALSQTDLKNYVGRVVADQTLFNPVLKKEVARGAELTSAPGYSFSYDSRIGGLSPDRGVLLRFTQDFAGLGGDTRYIKSEAFALAERKVLGEQVTLRAIVEGGAIKSLGGYETRVTERFFGTRKLRGFESSGFGPRDTVKTGGVGTDEALGGNYYSVARFEVDFPLGIPTEYGISGGAFFDVGSLWGLDSTEGIDAKAYPRAAIGVSVLWDAPIGPLRLNFSRAVKKQDYDKERNFDLTISTRF